MSVLEELNGYNNFLQVYACGYRRSMLAAQRWFHKDLSDREFLQIIEEIQSAMVHTIDRVRREHINRHDVTGAGFLAKLGEVPAVQGKDASTES